MHNGGIADFPKLKRRLQRDLPDVAFNMVQGNTGMTTIHALVNSLVNLDSDSEWCFALLLSKVREGAEILSLLSSHLVLASRPKRKFFHNRGTAKGNDGHDSLLECLCGRIRCHRGAFSAILCTNLAYHLYSQV